MTETSTPPQAGEPEAPAPHGKSLERRVGLTFGKLVAAATAAVALVAGAVTLLFQVDPAIAPCLGGTHASFTGAPVFPNYPYWQFIRDMGGNPAGYTNPVGAEVRYSYQVQDLRGETLVVRATLVRLAKDGSIAAADTSALDQEDLFAEQTVKPDQCSQDGGGTFFAHLPSGGTASRYQIYLELYQGYGYNDRIALGQTPVFDG